MADPGVLAVACVVDSSLTLAAEWSLILTEYISPLLKRLSEVYLGYQFRLGLVTYATAVTRPTPLLTRRFFAPMHLFTEELRDNTLSLGIGKTCDGGTGGMAALEGLVAATEMFDDLRSCISSSHSTGRTLQANSPICHIFHVAASPPDDALYPSWNNISSFDDVTWESLPSELKKRDIRLTMINLQEFTQFSEFHSSVAMGSSQQPWFSVRHPHYVLLSGFPSSQQNVLQRPVENLNVEKASEPKRLRAPQLPSKISPTIANAGTSQQVQPSISATNSIHPPFNASSQQSSVSSKPSTMTQQAFQQTLLERFRAADVQFKSLDDRIKNAIANGDIQLAESLKQDRDRHLANYLKFRSTVASFAQNQARSAANAMQETLIGGTSISQNPIASTSTQMPPSAASQLSHIRKDQPVGTDNGHDSQPVTQPAHSRTTSSTLLQFPNANQNAPHGLQTSSGVSPQVTPQMQRSMEQQRNRQTPLHALEQGISANAPAEPPKSLPGNIVWQGVLAWNGSDAATQGRKEVKCQVFATLQSGGESHPETWPAALMLTPSREPAVSLQDLQIWMKRHRPVLCAFQPQPSVEDSTANESHYRSLVQLLMVKNIYALAAWSLPSGIHENGVLVFPVNGCGLAGAFFPLTGIPECPKPGAGMMNLVPAAVAVQLQKLNPEQRNKFLAQMMQQRAQLQLQHQQQQQQQQKQESLVAGGSQSWSNAAPQRGIPAASNVQPAMNTTTQSGIANMSYEVMQSFMQRSADGGEPALGSGG